MEIRDMRTSDWDAVRTIYQEGMDTGMATFETTLPTWEQWNRKYLQSCRLVGTLEGHIVGFAVLSAVSSREVYKGVAEVSVYIGSEYRGHGLGKALLNALITCSEAADFWTLQAVVFASNTASLRVHQSCGFRTVGVRERIGQRHGVWHDNVLMEKRSDLNRYQ